MSRPEKLSTAKQWLVSGTPAQKTAAEEYIKHYRPTNQQIATTALAEELRALPFDSERGAVLLSYKQYQEVLSALDSLE